jgi:hypothetical protein
MGHASKGERKKGRSHRADGREKRGFEGVSQLPISERDRRPIATGIESEETAESIHFAPPLTCMSAMAQSYGGIGSTSNDFYEVRYAFLT